ncbi:SbmA/BacA-like family [Musa troglodytarum]|uniref:SbmA/BacA-like family n=1 Tax=Musa troglodytarum TaxID=320322 RepID=A0A9E7F8Y5_9LILI|nr:SbmA/BacA-like family [Musa troglodytarum]
MAFPCPVSAPATAAQPLLLIPVPPQRLSATCPSSRLSSSLLHRTKISLPPPSLPPLMRLRRRRVVRSSAAAESSDSSNEGKDKDEQRVGSDLKTLLKRFWKVAAPYWSSEDKVQARLRLAAVFALTLGTTGISVGFNFLGRDFYNALANKDQEQFTKQLLYYLGAFAGGIPVFVIRDYARETLSLRWRSWMTSYYMKRYFKNQTFYKIQSQSIIDNPDQRIVDDLSSFTGTALSFSLILFNAAVDLVSFSNILFGIYPPLFVVLLVYSLGGTAISVFLGKGLVTLNFMQEKKEADFRYGLVRVRENAESIAFYGGEGNEMQLLLQRFRQAFENLTELLISSRNLEFFTNGYRYLIQILPAAVVAPMYFSGKIEFGVINQSVSAFNHILSDFSLIVYQFQSISAFSAVIDRLGEFDDILDDSESYITEHESNDEVMGPSGSGKTSFLRALAGLWNTGKGNVIFYVEDAGKHARSVSADTDSSKSEDAPKTEEEQRSKNRRPSSVFFLPQKPYMVLGTLRQQLLYPTWSDKIHPDLNNSPGSLPFLSQAPSLADEFDKPEKPTIDDMIQVLERVRLGDILSRFNGLDSIYEWSSVLSLGEQQRLAFARLLLSKPKLVLLDESTSALDGANEAHLYRQIEAAGITYISIGHRMTLQNYHKNILYISKYDARGSERNWHFEPISQTATEANSTC